DTGDSLGFFALRTGDHLLAIDDSHQALVLYRHAGNAYQVAELLDNMGHPYAALGRHDRARTVWQEALELYREQGRDADAERLRRLSTTPNLAGDPVAGPAVVAGPE
ncbi:MAG: tetratricopeptide repeat protein, partial [Saccharothrix sp.]|nr:tetratricopeptide repeat protein [Saccharothrix sp.]